MKPWWTVHPYWVLIWQIHCFIASWRDKGFQWYLGKAIGVGTSHGAWFHGPPILQLHPLAIYPFSRWTFSKLPRKNRKKTSAKKHTQRIHTSSSTLFLGGRVWWHIFPKEKKWFSESSDLLDSLNPNVKKMKMCPTKSRLFIWANIETHWNSATKHQQPNSPKESRYESARIYPPWHETPNLEMKNKDWGLNLAETMENFMADSTVRCCHRAYQAHPVVKGKVPWSLTMGCLNSDIIQPGVWRVAMVEPFNGGYIRMPQINELNRRMTCTSVGSINLYLPDPVTLGILRHSVLCRDHPQLSKTPSTSLSQQITFSKPN